ncbi:DUF6777 domain-containing protein [Streptomyces cinereoruber]|uniref:DUF6777 domain-containing protein n=1 Tax=Streptomyces cinereoruber TaxID=67260 RepID=UPI003C2E60D1
MGAERKKGKNVTSHPPSGPPSGPPSVPPTGPPSGPLSGPSTRPNAVGPPPPSGPPSSGSGGSGGSGGGSGDGGGSSRYPEGGKGGGPWWRSVPKVASITAVLVAAVALIVVLTSRSGDGGGTNAGGGEVFLQSASATGPDPFTQSTARATESAPPASLPPRTGSAEAGTPRVSGAAPGLYGGTRSVASCDVEQQVRYLSGEPAKNAAFASVLRVSANEVPGYLRSLTPLQLRADTRVTNHGFKDGSATAYQAVLQSGTAVLVDDRGVPRVRCACGNPLTEPVAQKNPRTTGTPWPGYDADQVVVVAPATTVVNTFVVYDPENGDWFARKHGDTGDRDEPTAPPTSTSPAPCPPGASPCPPGSTSPGPSTSSPGPSPDSSPPAPQPDSSPPPPEPQPDSSPPRPDSSPPPPEPQPDSPPPPEPQPDTSTPNSGPAPETSGNAPADPGTGGPAAAPAA